jgi:hypothetical protein
MNAEEVKAKYAIGMAQIIDLMQEKGYSPRDTQGICLSLAATIALNYLKVPIDKIQNAMDVFGDACGVNLAYHGCMENPTMPKDKGVH